MNAYDALASIYDPWQDLYGCFSTAVLERLEDELHRFIEVRSFLDLGCATGRLLLKIGARHPHVRLAGIDGSDAMLARAQVKPGAERVVWRCAQLGNPLELAAVDAVGSFFNTLNHLTSAGQLEATFRSVADVLRPEGRFLFDVNNRTGFRAWWSGASRYVGRNWALDMAGRFDDDAGHAYASLRLATDNGVAETTVTERLFEDREIEAALARTGFAVVRRGVWAPLGDRVAGATFWHVRLA